MTAICGAIDTRRTGAERLRLAGVHDVLAPFGRPEQWAGPVGRCHAVLAAHRQPGTPPNLAVDERTGLVACADAHFDRRAELAAELRLEGSAGAAEVALAAYRRWGRDMVDHVTGFFVFVIADPRNGGVFLARDHFGGRSVSIHESDGVVAFATTALALTGFPGVGHELDKERLAEVIGLGYGTDRTFVRGVRSVPPGTAVWIDDRSGTRSWRWWNPDRVPVRDAGSLELHAAALSTALEEAVRSALDGARRPAVLLSGGLDSPSVAAVAARELSPETLRTYTSVAPPRWEGPVEWGWIPDERSAVELLVEQYPTMDPHFIHVKDQSPFQYHETLWELGAGPARNALNMMWVYECLQEATADGVDVILSGGAGNFAFSADGPMWLADLARRGRFLKVAHEVKAWSAATRRRRGVVIREDLLAPLVPIGLKRRRWERRRRGPLHDWLAATALRPEQIDRLDLDAVLPTRVAPNPRGWTRDLVRMFDDSGAQAETETALRALFELDYRDPLADRRLIEVALEQPDYWRRHAGVNRAVCRAAMRDVIPPEILNRTTLGAQLPDWFDRLTDFKEQVREEVKEMGDHPASREVIDVERLERLVQHWPERGQMADQDVISDYGMALSRSMFVSRYVRWFEERGRRVAAGGAAVVVRRPWQE